jgi:hypothetical protein
LASSGITGALKMKTELIDQARKLLIAINNKCEKLDPYSPERRRLNNILCKASGRYVRRQYLPN